MTCRHYFMRQGDVWVCVLCPCRRDRKGHAMGFAFAEDEAMEAGR